MPCKKSGALGYRYHVSGQAVVTLDGKSFYLGPHDSPESKASCFALLNEYHANGMQLPDVRQPTGPLCQTSIQAPVLAAMVRIQAATGLVQTERASQNVNRE